MLEESVGSRTGSLGGVMGGLVGAEGPGRTWRLSEAECAAGSYIIHESGCFQTL